MKDEKSRFFLTREGNLDIKGICQHYSDKAVFTFIYEGNKEKSLTGKDLLIQISTIEKELNKKLMTQDKVILLFEQGLEYICALFACFCSNMAAIPVSITTLMQKEEIEEKLKPIIQNSGAKCILTNSNFREYITNNQLEIINIDTLDYMHKNIEAAKEYSSQDIAIILYTSGSTSEPKGVMLTHENVKYQTLHGAMRWEIDEESRMVSWMPQYHNLGLFAGILAPFVTGARSIIFSAEHFIKNPRIWFEKIDQYEATHTVGPNFAYNYCCEVLNEEQLEGISCASLKAIISGGEPIKKDIIDRFFSKNSRYGFKVSMFCPEYGMSEAGIITNIRPHETLKWINYIISENNKVILNNGPTSRVVSSCGTSDKDTQVLCINMETKEICPDNVIGEIVIKTKALAKGYYGQDELNKKMFNVTIPAIHQDGFFRTGDKGFFNDGHLYIVGREKEMMIIHGKNFYPVDLENALINKVTGISKKICVFSVDIEDEERVVVVVASEGNQDKAILQENAKTITRCISEIFKIGVYQIVFVDENVLPKTGTGKIQRLKCRKLFSDGQLESHYSHTNATVYKEGVTKKTLDILKKKLKKYLL